MRQCLNTLKNDVNQIFFCFQIKAKNYDKVEKVSSIKYALTFMLKFKLRLTIYMANSKC